jgi:zinc carboxypeptidase
MKRWTLLASALVAVLVMSGAAPGAGNKNKVSLDFYRATVSQAVYSKLLAKNVDIAAAEDVAGGVRLDMVLSPAQAGSLQAKGIDVSLLRNSQGLTARQAAAAQMSSGYTVWRDYDGPDGMAAYLRAVARANPQIAKVEIVGRSGQGRPILALKLTQGAQGIRDGSRPAVLYSALQHAREWIAGEVDRRLINHYVSSYRSGDKSTKDLLKATELWFLPVANPDGYQYTFESPDTRLWRKTLTNNDGEPGVSLLDGVDPNRNYPEHWNYDQEGSSSITSSQTYRGTAAGSEPETQAMMGLLSRIKFKFQVNYHSFGEWLLYPEGWQIGTPSGDDPIYYALSGNLDNPAIAGFNPGLSSDVLYVTNGETTDYAHVTHGTLAWTPELGPGCDTCGFVFPDDEALVQAEFVRNLPFALSVARSAPNPANPKSVVGLTTRGLYVKSDDTYKYGLPGANFTFSYSYGDPQEVRVLAMRTLGAVTAKYRINGGAVQSAPTTEWNGGQKYGSKTDRYYRVMRGFATGTTPGDSVEVWFQAGGQSSDHFTYQAVNETTHDTLVVVAEDRTGQSPPGGNPPAPPIGGPPQYLNYYVEALGTNGVIPDVYDIDTRNRKAPDALGVLSHYKAVVWEIGDDVITREAGWGGGLASRLAMDNIFEMRDYMNEGGRVLYAGKNAGVMYMQAQFYDPTEANGRCGDPTVAYRCIQTNGSGDGMNDVFQYWFGSFLVNPNAGQSGPSTVFDAHGTDTPLAGLSWSYNGPDTAPSHTTANSFISTSGILPKATYPQFDSWVAAKYDRPGGPFEPHSPTKYAYSQIADQSFKRLTHTVHVPATGADMSFWVSYNTEADWDMVFVEAHTVGEDNWTTLEDVSGHNYTSQATGESCEPENGPGGWRTIHPVMDHYQTIVPGRPAEEVSCEPHGTTGIWWAANGSSGGWQNWLVNLAGHDDRFLGDDIEVSITYVSDWGTQGLGVFVDDIVVAGGSTDFESGAGGWQMPGAPAGSAPNFNTWVVTDGAGFPEGAVIATPSSLLWGFGLEGVTGAATRAQLMGQAITYLRR